MPLRITHPANGYPEVKVPICWQLWSVIFNRSIDRCHRSRSSETDPSISASSSFTIHKVAWVSSMLVISTCACVTLWCSGSVVWSVTDKKSSKLAASWATFSGIYRQAISVFSPDEYRDMIRNWEWRMSFHGCMELQSVTHVVGIRTPCLYYIRAVSTSAHMSGIMSSFTLATVGYALLLFWPRHDSR